ncbi:MAG: hypothetical protein QM661_09005 [Solimonas sp.]
MGIQTRLTMKKPLLIGAALLAFAAATPFAAIADDATPATQPQKTATHKTAHKNAHKKKTNSASAKKTSPKKSAEKTEPASQ